MRVAYVDPFGGASGDMLLGALIDAGADLAALNELLSRLGLGLAVTVSRVQRSGIAATKATVLAGGAPADPTEAAAGVEAAAVGPAVHASHVHAHGHTHDGAQQHTHDHDAHEHTHDHRTEPARDGGHAHHEHRGLREIEAIIRGAELPENVKSSATGVFRRLAIAEAAVHGSTPEDVHFHEVGASDAIGDIVGTCAALHLLSVQKLLYGPIPTGGGTVRAAHGVLPVPAPATLELLRGTVVWDPGVRHEMVTPTGAALLVGLGEQVPGWPAMSVERIGVGAGSRDTQRANIVRIVIGSASETHSGLDSRPAMGADQVVLVEANLDDVTGQVVGDAIEALLKVGALDAWWTACGMKKGRPGIVFSSLVRPMDLPAIAVKVFELLPTLGVRYRTLERFVLAREHQTVQTPFGPIRIKVGSDGERVFVATPEYEDCRASALAAGVPVRRVILAAARAARVEPPTGSVT